MGYLDGLPKGTLVTYQATPEELLDVEAASIRRGVREWEFEARHIRRDDLERRSLEEFCTWLHSFGLDLIGTVTYSDEYAERHGIYSIRAAIRDTVNGLRSVKLRGGTISGFRGRYVACGEWHPSGRLVPHVHLALESNGAPHQMLVELGRYFDYSRGRSRFEKMRDVEIATLYGLKDTIKHGSKDPETLELRLRHRVYRRRNGAA